MLPCLTLSIIRNISRVKWSNPGNGVAPSPIPHCSSYWKGILLVTLDYVRQLYLLLLFVWFQSCLSLRPVAKPRWQSLVYPIIWPIARWRIVGFAPFWKLLPLSEKQTALSGIEIFQKQLVPKQLIILDLLLI